MAEVGLRVAPGDEEHRHALLHGMAHEGVLRLQVEDVELVDAGRHDQQRALMHLLRRRRVLDELDQFVLEDHLAGRHRQVAADLEGGIVGHRDAALAEVGDQVLDAGGDAGALRLQRRADEFRIGRHEIRGRHGVDELAGEEFQPVARRLVVHRHGLDQPVEEIGIQQIGLAEVVEIGTFRPLRRGEALVRHLGRGPALPSLQHVLPEGDMARGEFFLQAGDGFVLRKLRGRRGLAGLGALLLRHEVHEPLRERLPGLKQVLHGSRIGLWVTGHLPLLPMTVARWVTVGLVRGFCTAPLPLSTTFGRVE